jgi:O-antigen/teichoic acid export membrane protein
MTASFSAPAGVGALLKSFADNPRTRALAFFGAGGERGQTQREALIAFCVRVASAGLLYVTQVVLARWIGSFEYGVYVFVWTWVLVLGGLSPLGLSLVMMRLLPEYREKGEHALFRGLVRGGRMLVLAIATAVAVAGLIGLWLFGASLDDHYVLPAYLALVCVPLYALSDVQDGIGRGHGWIAAALVPPYILRPLLLLASMAVMYAAGFAMEAKSAAAGAIVATWTAALVQTFLINRRLRGEMTPGPRRYDFQRWLTTSLPLLIIGGSELVLQNTDVLVISRFMTPHDVGIYFAAAKTMSLIMFVHYSVGSAVAHRFAGLHARGDTDGLKAIVRDAVNWTFWPSLAGALLILALGKPLLSLFGAQFEDGYPVMFIIVVGLLFRAAMGPIEHLLNMLGEQRTCATVLVATTALNIVLNFALVPTFGLLGAATATSISLSAAAFLNTAAARRRLGIEAAIWRNL